MPKTIARVMSLLVTILLASGMDWTPLAPHLAHGTESNPSPDPPFTLQEVMQTFAHHYTAMVNAILEENFHQIEDSAQAIAHNTLPTPIKVGTRNKFGKKFDGFEKMYLTTQAAAATIHQAAVNQDLPAVIQGNFQLFTLCTDCHRAYRQ